MQSSKSMLPWTAGWCAAITHQLTVSGPQTSLPVGTLQSHSSGKLLIPIFECQEKGSKHVSKSCKGQVPAYGMVTYVVSMCSGCLICSASIYIYTTYTHSLTMVSLTVTCGYLIENILSFHFSPSQFERGISNQEFPHKWWTLREFLS